MPDLVIKPTAGSGNKLILQDQGSDAILTSANNGATLYAGIAVGKAPTDFNSTGVSLECIDGLTISSTTTNPNIYLDNQTTNGKKWTFQAESGDGALTCKNVTDNNTAFQINTSGQFLGIKMASGNGIYMDGGTTSANRLDDYEEGSWSPRLNGNDKGLDGMYTKIGNLVRCHCWHWTNTTGNEANCILSGLPFSANRLTHFMFNRIRGGDAEYHWGILDSGGNTIGMMEHDTSSWSNYQASQANWTFLAGGATITAWDFSYTTDS